MAHLIRNSLFGTITTALTNVATTVDSAEFANLPVVTAPDRMILILDPAGTGGGVEIMHITAHTAAATTVTVERAQEGTTAVAQASGATWFHGPSVNTLYGTPKEYNPKAAPDTANALDDEFLTEGSGTPAGWTLWDPGTTIASAEITEHGFEFNSTNVGGSTLGGYYKAAPGSPTGNRYSVYTTVSCAQEANVLHRAGIAIFDDVIANPATTQFRVLDIARDIDDTGPGPTVIQASDWSDFNSFVSNFRETEIGGGTVYMQAQVDLTSAFIRLYWSLDGLDWLRIANLSGGNYFVPDAVGLFVNRVGFPRFKNFRVVEDAEWNDPYPGRMTKTV